MYEKMSYHLAMFSAEQDYTLRCFAEQSDKLLARGIIRTDNFTGEIGEYVACQHFCLQKADRVTRAIDARDNLDRTYQIKAKVITNNRFAFSSNSIYSSEFDFLVVVYFDPLFTPLRIIRIPSDQLTGNECKITPSFLSTVTHDLVEGDLIRLPRDDAADIRRFGEIYNRIRGSNITRSRRIVGDIGEHFACQHLNLTLADNLNEKGVDAVDRLGVKYEIKTRRVYESARRTSRTRRLNGLVGKSAEYLAVVVLDWSFRCAGMWLLPMKNISNPKSAHLGIVRTVPGAKTIVATTTSWLQ